LLFDFIYLFSHSVRLSFPFFTRYILYRTHSWCSNTCARPQSGIVCRNRWIQYALCTGMHVAHHTNAWTDVISHNTNPYKSKHAKRGVQYVLRRNFGELEFDWDTQQVIVRVFDITGKSLISSAWSFDVLSGIIEPPSTIGQIQLSDYEHIYQRLHTSHNSTSTSIPQPNDWICINHRGVSSFGRKLFGVITPISVVMFLITLPFNMLMLLAWLIWRRYKCKKLHPIGNKLKQL
jgi:hypothetical protein